MIRFNWFICVDSKPIQLLSSLSIILKIYMYRWLIVLLILVSMVVDHSQFHTIVYLDHSTPLFIFNIDIVGYCYCVARKKQLIGSNVGLWLGLIGSFVLSHLIMWYVIGWCIFLCCHIPIEVQPLLSKLQWSAVIQINYELFLWKRILWLIWLCEKLAIFDKTVKWILNYLR
jgi:hypothetical protein